MTSTASTFSQARDQRIQHDVLQQIAWQPDVNAKDISVKLNDGNVALTGFPHSYIEKTSAERAAKSVVGVLSIANDIEVRPKGKRSDPEIARDVVEALRLHSTVPDDLRFIHYNFARIHKTLRITPAMVAALSDHVCSHEEIAALAA